MADEAGKPGTSAAETIFLAALELSPTERAAYLVEACGEDRQLLQRVESLLRAHEAPKGFLPEQPGVRTMGCAIPEILLTSLTEQPGEMIGRYKLREKIGEGGCGTVYLAEQEKPVRRRVALKIIKLGMDTRQVVGRFEAEREALALMDHPNIAKVLDAGATDAGRPYFVMELVGGIKITDYCEQNDLATTQRLNLFTQVCRAIQHAHQKGIIHRDIKPSNVLVVTQDGVPVPKVIDFGIAKATQGRLIDDTVFTAFEQFIGTPAYMSPEQAQLGGLDVDTRSDIYSLGVLLYELLTGRTPFDLKELLAGGFEAMRRTIQEKEPPTPSTRLKQEGAARLARTDKSVLHTPHSTLDKDLDWIVMKCLEKDRTRRYETANGLASDIERYLKQELVVARPPSTLYRIHKFIRRNGAIVTATTAIATALVIGIAVSGWEAVRARRAERSEGRLLKEAQAARNDATEQLWRSHLAEARARRASGQTGRHFESLAVLRKAAAIRPSLALRNEAIASMVLADIRWVSRKGYVETPNASSLDPRFEWYAVCERTGSVSIRRVADDDEVKRLPGLGGTATTAAAFSPDGKFLPIGYGGEHWSVWDWAKGVIAINVESVKGFDFTPDSKTFGVSDGTNIVLHDLTSRKRLSTISLPGLLSPGSPGWFRFDPSGQRIALYATRERSNVLIVDTRTGQIMRTLQHAGEVWNVAWHPDGRHLAIGSGDKAIQIWDSFSGERVQRWRTETSVSVSFSHHGDILASSGWDGYTRLWDRRDGRELIKIYKAGYNVTFGPDDHNLSTLCSTSEATSLDLFEVTPGLGLRTLYEAREIDGNGGGRPIMDTSGKLLAYRTQEGIGLWDLKMAQQIGVLRLDKDRALIGFDAEGENLILTGSEGLLSCAITKPAAGGERNLGNAVLVTAACADSTGPRAGWISKNGKTCAIVGNDRCQIFRADTFEKLAETGNQPGMRYSDINSDGSLIAGGAWHHTGVMVWDARTGSLIKELHTGNERSESGASVAFSPDGSYLVTATAYEYCFWALGSWAVAKRIPQEPGNDFCPTMAFSRDGRIFAGTHSRNKIRLYDAASGNVLADLEAPNAAMITGLAFNEDDSQLAACEAADALRLWNLREIRAQLTELGLGWD